MNPITNAKNLQKLNQRELALGVTGRGKSWHDQYKDSAWIFIGGLPYDLSEGDIICVFSQYGEVVNINLVRDKSTGKSKGYAFLCYEDQRSTVLAVDNLNTIKLLGRIIRVDHVADYKKPKEKGDEDEVTLKLRAEGCAPRVPDPTATPSSSLPDLPQSIRPPACAIKPKKAKKDKKKKKKKKMKLTVKVERGSETDSSSSDDESSDEEDRKSKLKSAATILHPDDMKREKEDRGYDSAVHGHRLLSREGENVKDIKPDVSHWDSSQRSRDKHRGDPSDWQSERVSFKHEPSDSGTQQHEKQYESRKESSEEKCGGREDRNRRDVGREDRDRRDGGREDRDRERRDGGKEDRDRRDNGRERMDRDEYAHRRR